MITITQKGKFNKLNKFFKKSVKITKVKNINLFGEKCIEKLKQNTPIDSGLTASSWRYSVVREKNSVRLRIDNTNIQNGVNIAIIIEYGHMTEAKTWVEGKNFIQPAIRQAYLELVNSVWKEMTNL